MQIDISAYNPNSRVLFIFIGSNHKEIRSGASEYDEKKVIFSFLSSQMSQYLKQIREEIRLSLDSVVWQNKKASDLKMNENLVRGPDFGGNDPRARYLPAIERFTGRFFNEGGLGEEGINHLLKSGHHALIIDGLHGFTTPTEPIQLFNCPLEIQTLSIQKRWREQNALTSILTDYIRKNSITHVIDLSARKFYRDLIDWYEVKEAGSEIFHVYFEEYAGNESIIELSKICRNNLFTSSEQDLLSIKPESFHATPEGNYIFSNKIEPPIGWAVEPAGIFSESDPSELPALENVRLNDLVDTFEKNMRDFLDQKLKTKTNWIVSLTDKSVKDSLKKKVNRYLNKYPMILENEINLLDFCTIFEYSKIIKMFWPEIFEPIFRSEIELEKHIENITELRNNLKHNQKILPSTQKIGEGSLIWFEDIFRKYNK
jgi:cytoplasmic iron level regulating protein YaaA (DUF328/UPF0246 family)